MSLSKTFLAIGIAVLLAVFISYGLYVVYEKPKYGYVDTSSCIDKYNCYNMTIHCDNESTINGTLVKNVPYNSGCYEKIYASSNYKQCMNDFDDCTNSLTRNSEDFKHSRNSFYILIILSVISIIVGALVKKEGIGSGFIGGGVLIVLWSLAYTTDYWTTLNKYFKLVAVGVVLVLLIYLGYKKIEEKFAKKR